MLAQSSSRKQKKSVVPKKQNSNLPPAPSLLKTIGPSFILLGLALGSGELLLWPYLAANYGLGLLWGALLGVSFQYVLNTEVMRYTLARGESVFLGFRQLSWFWPLWFILSTFIPWSLPGFSSAASQILATLFPSLVSQKVAAIGLLLFTGSILTLGKTVLKTMETWQRTMIMLGIPFISLLTLGLSQPVDWQLAFEGIIGKGDGWWFFPPNIGLFAFLGAFAYSGAGGNLNLAQTYYIKEKGFGMGKGTQKISSLLQSGKQAVHLEGRLFSDTAANRHKWQQWWSLVTKEHLLVFWSLGFLTIFLLSVLAHSLVFGQATEEGIQFLYKEANVISQVIHPVVGLMFLLVAAQMLFSTQLGVLESSSRIISENFLLVFYRAGKKVDLSKSFFVALWGQITLGIIILLLGFKEPRFLITLSAVLNAAAMMVAFPLIFWLNKKRLPVFLEPSTWRKFVLASAFIFFLIFVTITAAHYLS